MSTALDSPEQVAKIISKVLTGLLAVIVLASVISSFSVIAPGNTGVIFNIWTGSLRSVPQGMAWRMPWITQVQSYPTALRTYTMVRRTSEGSSIGDDSIDLPTREGQHITQDISVTYNTSEDKAAQVFKSFRGSDIAEIEATFIRRTIITVAQNSAGQMSLSELISSKRDELQASIQKSLSVEINKMGFTLDKVNLGASHLPQTLEAQMQQKMAAQQQAQTVAAAPAGGAAAAPAAAPKKEKEEKKGETVLRSERYYGMCSRTFTLMHEVDESKAEAKYNDGVLELTLPKKVGGAVKELKVH